MSDDEKPELRGLDLILTSGENTKRKSTIKRKNPANVKESRKILARAKKDSAEIDLEDIVFGGALKLTEELKAEKKTKVSHSEESIGSESEEETEDIKEEPVEKKAAWVDDEDDLLIGSLSEQHVLQPEKSIGTFLREKHEKIFNRPKWAIKAEAKVRDEEADQLLRNASTFIDSSSTGRPLAATTLDFTRCPQMNKFCFQKSAISSLAFHPTSEIAMLAHRNGVVTFLSVDAAECNKIQSVYFRDFEISCAKLSHNGMEMMCGSSKYRTLHCYDLMSGSKSQVTFPKAHELTNMKEFVVSPDGKYIAVFGRFGNIYLLCGETKQQICTLKMNEEVSAVAFTKDGKLFSHGGTYVYLWDIGKRRCIQKYLDDGCLRGQSIALSPDEQFLATGCNSGIVNIYDAAKLRSDSSRTPEPLKCIKNIVNPVTSLEFNFNSECLFMASRLKPEALKMLHMGTLTAFSNFPNLQHKFRSCSDVAFSPHGGYLAVGTTLGSVNLLRMNHYSSY